MGEKDGNDHTPSKNSVPNNTNNVRMIAKDILELNVRTESEFQSQETACSSGKQLQAARDGKNFI